MPQSYRKIRGRFAPSPTGQLHLGSISTAVGSWLTARKSGGEWLLRMDDLDTQRVLPGCADDIIRTLESFGLFWDGEISWQSKNLDAYNDAFEKLLNSELIYRCSCSRKEIMQTASAPHNDDTIPYFGSCRFNSDQKKPLRSWRVIVPDEEISFTDIFHGRYYQNLKQACGDFVVRRGDGCFAYQLAVVIDDAITGVNQIVRGSDLLPSTPRQIHLHRILDIEEPKYGHLPLVTNCDGSKLSKRDHLISVNKEDLEKPSSILMQTLNFLGINIPTELHNAPCETLLQWGLEQFEPNTFMNKPIFKQGEP